MERRIVKMYEDFNTKETNDFLNKDKVYLELKDSSEEILNEIGIEKETIWFDLLNQLVMSESEEEFDEIMIEINELIGNE